MIEYYPELKIDYPFASSQPTAEEIYKIIEKKEKALLRGWLSHALPHKDLITEMQAFIGPSECVEIGAGKGLWAYLIGQVVKATDKFPQKFSYVPVVECDSVAAVKTYAHCQTLLLIWPPYDNMASAALEHFTGAQVIYIGEGRKGCTGDDLMFEIFEKSFTLVSRKDLQTINNNTDQVYFYKRL